jgi:dynein heavy chain
LEAAEKAVKCITKGDIAELKNLSSPPPDVKLVTSVVCMLQGIAGEKKMNKDTQKKETDYWGVSVKMMMQPGFLDSLVKYDKESMDQKLIDSIQPYITLDNFQIERLQKVSSVAMNLGKWCFAMDKYFNVNKIVIPKKKLLAEAQAEFAEVSALLKDKQAKLKVEMDKVARLKAQLKETQDKVQSLND